MVLIFAAVAVAYLPAFRAGYIWDDDDYVTDNVHLRTLSGLGSIWFEIGATSQYYPAVHTSFWLEYHVWELNPLGFHLTNALLHALGAALLWFVLRRLSLPGAWLAAAIFALHPVQVESVAWITERKNVLSGVFYLAALLAYLRFDGLNGGGPQRRPWRYYGLSMVLFGGALLSKSVTCSLPAVVLLLLWWKRGQLGGRDLFRVTPMLVVGVAMGLVTVWMEKHTVGAQGREWGLSSVERCLVAGRALWFYLGKLVWPVGLTFVYPRWQIDPGRWWQFLYPLAALCVPVLLWFGRSRLGRAPLVAALFFGGTLVPALGSIDVFPMRYSFVADHFQYLASIGPIAAFAALLAVGLGMNRRPGRALLRFVVPAVVLVVLGLLTWRQSHAYRDPETLWRDTLVKNPSAWMAHNNLGKLFNERGRIDQAMTHYRQALRLKPDFADAHNNLACALDSLGSSDQAVWHFEEALRLEPELVRARNNLGLVLAGMGRFDEAVRHYNQALRLQPGGIRIRGNLADTLLAAGRLDQAVSQYRQVLRAEPADTRARANYAVALMRLGHSDQAIEQYGLVLQSRPDFAEAHNNLANALAGQGRYAEAVEHYTRALQLQPAFAQARNNLGLVLLELGEPDRAARHFVEVIKQAPGNADAHFGLGRALILLGKEDQAVLEFRRALKINPQHQLAARALAQTETQP